MFVHCEQQCSSVRTQFASVKYADEMALRNRAAVSSMLQPHVRRGGEQTAEAAARERKERRIGGKEEEGETNKYNAYCIYKRN